MKLAEQQQPLRKTVEGATGQPVRVKFGKPGIEVDDEQLRPDEEHGPERYSAGVGLEVSRLAGATPGIDGKTRVGR